MTRRLIVPSILLVLLAGCAGQSGPAATPSSPVTQSSPAVSAVAASASPSKPAANSPLEGTWKTRAITRDDMRGYLRAAGQQKWIQPFFAPGGSGDSNVFTLRVLDGRWVQYWSKDGGIDETNDDGSYAITGDSVTVTHNEGTDTFRWSVSGDTLTLSYVDSNIPPTNGIPEEIYQRVFYSMPYFRSS